MKPELVDLSDAIGALRADLSRAAAASSEGSIHFEVQPIELTVEAVVSKDARGKIGWSLVGASGGRSSSVTHRIVLNLRAFEKTPGGLEQNVRVSDPQRNGPPPRIGRRSGSDTAS